MNWAPTVGHYAGIRNREGLALRLRDRARVDHTLALASSAFIHLPGLHTSTRSAGLQAQTDLRLSSVTSLRHQ